MMMKRHKSYLLTAHAVDIGSMRAKRGDPK